MENQREATKAWDDFFGILIQEIRWDLFEDFLYYNSEVFLGKHVTVVKSTKWDEYFDAFFGLFAKKCESTEFFKEIPEIPFSDVEVIYKGHTVRKSDWIAHVEKYGYLYSSNGVEATLLHMANRHALTAREMELGVEIKSSHF